MASAVLIPPTTPLDYHRIISTTLTVPSNTQASIPVGLLACQRDPLLRSLETIVVSVSVAQPPGVAVGKKTKKAVIAPDVPNEPLLHILLHDTVIFPEGGGQPTDTGIITTIADGVTWEVVQAKRHGGHAVHYVRVFSGNIEGAVLAFSPGAKVVVSLDHDRRYDHMSMHTSQHLLSALLETRLGLPTLSWSLTSYPSPCYVEVPRGMNHDEIASIQAEANKLVFEGRRVHIEVEELEPVQERAKSAPKLESGRSVGKSLPEDYTGGVKRVVVIDGVDRNPCCGTHLPSIHNLQLFLLPHTEALSRSSTTSARLYFLAGPRLIAHLSSTHGLLTSTASILSCGTPSVPDRTNQVVEERKKSEKRVTDVEAELASQIAKELVGGIKATSTFCRHTHRVDDTTNALGFLSSIAFDITNSLSGTGSYIFVFSSSPSSQTSSSITTVLVLGSDEAKVKAVGDGLKSDLGVKGGGKGFRWSGKFTGVWKDARDSAAVDTILGSV